MDTTVCVTDTCRAVEPLLVDMGARMDAEDVRLRFFAPGLSLGPVFLADVLGTLLARRITGGDFLLKGGEQLFQGAFDLAAQT